MNTRRWLRPPTATLLPVAAAVIAACSPSLETAPLTPGVAVVEAANEAADEPTDTVETTTAVPTTTEATDDVSSQAPLTTPKPTSLECTGALPIETRIGQVLMPFIEGGQLDRAAEIVERFGPGGMLLMSWSSDVSPTGLIDLQARSSIAMHLAVDEEGGPVQRLRRISTIPSAREVAETRSVAEAEDLLAAHAAAVADIGITMVFAPVVDVAPLSGPDTMGQRAFSTDPEVVADYGAAYIRAWQRAGVTPVLKHFPGHGSASADTHDARAVTPPLEVLAGRDLEPYRLLAEVDGVGVMVGHLDVPGLTDAEGVPASLSTAAITGLLRGGLGYDDALVVTDALNMTAIGTGFSEAAAALAALVAGADVLLYADLAGTGDIVDHLSLAILAGRLDVARLDDAADRVLRTKGVDACTLIE